MIKDKKNPVVRCVQKKVGQFYGLIKHQTIR